MPVLGDVFSAADVAKRKIIDALMHPKNALAQTAGNLNDAGQAGIRDLNLLADQNVLRAQGSVMADAQMYKQAEDASRQRIINLLMNFAPVGNTYYRRTNGGPDNGAGYMMFSDNPDRITSYGKNQFVFDDVSGKTIDATDKAFLKDVIKALRSDPALLGQYGGRAAPLAREANPRDIVESAGTWDAPALVEKIYQMAIQPKGIQAVRTRDGAIVFDPSLVRKQNHFD